MSRLPVTENELHAFVDGALPEGRRAEVEAYLATHPDEAARLEAYHRQSEALHLQYDAVLDEPVPERLRLAARPRRRPLLRAAAAAAWLAVGAAAGWLARGVEPPPVPRTAAIARDAALAHAVYAPEVRHPVEVGADQEQHLVAWLSKRLGGEVRPPQLTEFGYQLVGGRLLPADVGPAAQFMYQDGAGHRLTLYVRTDAGDNPETAFRFVQEGKVRIFYWVDGPFGYALSGEMEREPLLRAANSVYRQLNP
ncbi:MAG: anti-sigma factor [Gammaproteobacteria bacterium]|jgi:anti-sigma factor RsiW|nr:anti-sigma factor [Gammaproteobacteria bacterium]